MENITNNIEDLIGHTPLLRLSNYIEREKLPTDIIAKLEFFNPWGSIKDRVALSMIEDAEKKLLLKKGSVIIEPTSGNTGIALAAVGILRGYKVIIVMPENMSIERMKIIKALGAKVELTKASEGMNGAIKKAEELSEKIPGSFIAQQFNNFSNPFIHKKATAREILEDTNYNVDIFVSGVGTGGTISGVGEALKEYKKDINVVAVEPSNSAVLSGKEPFTHNIQGIGAGFIPKIYNPKVVDEIVTVQDEEAFTEAKKIAKCEGLLVGISSGASVYAAKLLAKKEENKGKRIVVIFPDGGEKYLSTQLYN